MLLKLHFATNGLTLTFRCARPARLQLQDVEDSLITQSRDRTKRFDTRPAFGLLVVMFCFVSGGATCVHRRTMPDFAPPRVFQSTPSLAQLADQVNRSLKIQRIESNTVTISSAELYVKLSGSIQWERPHNFSLVAYAGSRLLGTQLAAGSNSELFWLQTQTPSPTLYFARHDEFENQTGPRYALPVSPLWLREAMGIVEIDPVLEHEGPRVRTDGKLELRTLIPSPRGGYRRVLAFEPSTGVLIESKLYDNTERLVASAQMSDHEYYNAIETSLPHKVIVQLQPDQGELISFTMDIGFYLINEPSRSDGSVFKLPDSTGITEVNIAQFNAQPQLDPQAPTTNSGLQPLQQPAPTAPAYRSSRTTNFYRDSFESYQR